MYFKRLLTQTKPFIKNISTSAVRRGEHNTRDIVGSNLPFRIDNDWRFLFFFSIYVGTGIGLPFLMLRTMILQKNQD